MSTGVLNVKQIGGTRLFRPRDIVEARVRAAAEGFLRVEFAVGEYRDSKTINRILHRQFDYFYGLLQAAISKSASRHLAEMLLGEYDVTCNIDRLQKSRLLSDSELTYWLRMGPTIRRSLKHLMELATMLSPGEAPRSVRQRADILRNLEEVVIYCECLVELYALSDHAHGISPENTVFTVFPPGRDQYYDLSFGKDENHDDFGRRIQQDLRMRVADKDTKPPHLDWEYQATILDGAFAADLGFSFTDALSAIKSLIQNIVQPDPTSRNIPFARRSDVVEHLAAQYNWNSETADRLLKGFELRADEMLKEERRVCSPQQEHRAYRRGFFVFPHRTGPHLIFSREMAYECLAFLISGMPFQKLPAEWKTPGTLKAAAVLQREAGEWFERQVRTRLDKLGVAGRSYRTHIGSNTSRISIPNTVGEIDFLGISPSDGTLVVLECKYLESGMEPRFFRDDISSFTNGKKSFCAKLRKKVDWVCEHAKEILKVVAKDIPDLAEQPVHRVAGAFVTHTPTFASYSVKDFPCPSLTELEEATRNANAWPFESGVQTIP